MMDDQNELRDEIIQLTGISHDNPDDYPNMVWCPITSQYFHKLTTTACRIFPKRYRALLPASEYGISDLGPFFDDTYYDDIDTPRNAVVMLEYAEKAFDEHAWCFVPDVRSELEMAWWQKTSTPKNYKILILEPDNKWLKHSGSGMSYEGKQHPYHKRLGEIIYSGKKVEFKSNHRPYEKFLYMHYCCTMIKKLRYSGIDLSGELHWGKNRPKLVGLSEMLGCGYAAIKKPSQGGETMAKVMKEMIKGPTRNAYEVDKEWAEYMEAKKVRERVEKARHEILHGKKDEDRLLTRAGRSYSEPVPYRDIYDLD